jgi:hypothetical protein
MVKNGDANKAIWIAEMNWNTVPVEVDPGAPYGRVTEEQQARYAPLAYQRQQEEWPWVGVNAFWFFKRADDSEKGLAWYYFRMADPDFTLHPVYQAMKAYTQQPAKMYPGWFQEDHWAVTWEGWRLTAEAGATFGEQQTAERDGATARFTFQGTDLFLIVTHGPGGGRLDVSVDGGAAQTFDLRAGQPEFQKRLHVARALPEASHTIRITAQAGASLDGFVVRRVPDGTWALALGAGLVLGAAWLALRRPTTGDRR